MARDTWGEARVAVTAQLTSPGAISEFVAGFHEDCGETAELEALHSVRGMLLSAEALGAIMRRHHSHGWAEASGVGQGMGGRRR
jgi:hypothetical protein